MRSSMATRVPAVHGSRVNTFESPMSALYSALRERGKLSSCNRWTRGQLAFANQFFKATYSYCIPQVTGISFNAQDNFELEKIALACP